MDPHHHHTPGEAPTMSLRLLPGLGRDGGSRANRLTLVAAAMPWALLGLDSPAMLRNATHSFGGLLILLGVLALATGITQLAGRALLAPSSQPRARGRVVASETRRQRGIERIEAAASSRWTGRPSTPRLWGSC